METELRCCSEQIELTASVVGPVNVAWASSDLPLLSHVNVSNVGSGPVSPFSVDVSVDNFGAASISVGALEAGESLVIGDVCVELDVEKLWHCRELDRASFRLAIPHLDLAITRPITILGPWCWSYHPAARSTLASFVFPRHPLVEQIVLHAQDNQKKSFVSVLRETPDQLDETILKPLYECLCGCELNYEEPRKTSALYQVIRPPQRVFSSGSIFEAAVGNCLDLSLLMAACLENAGVCPILLVLGTPEHPMTHALTGCWNGVLPGFVPVVDDLSCIKRCLERSDFNVVECTGFAAGGATGRGKLSFECASELGRQMVLDAERISLIDVSALRPPFGRVHPLDQPNLDVVAQCAYWTAQDVAQRNSSRGIESIHLLYGLLSAVRQHGSTVIAKLGIDAGRAADHAGEHLPCGTATKLPRPTANYSQCQRVAEGFARLCGGQTVCEEHIWMALADCRSQNLGGLCQHLGIDLHAIADSLAWMLPTGFDGASASLEISRLAHSRA